jgi:AAA domain
VRPARRVRQVDEDAEYDEPNEPAVIEEVKAATQTFGGFKRKQSSGSKPEALIDGVLFRGENHIIFGSAGQGKTMLACYIASELTKGGESVVYLDHENGAGRIFKRMHALGCTEGMLEEHFYYFEDPASTLEDAPDYREMLAEIRPSLVVFDSLFGFMVAANLDENYGPDVGKWFDAFAPPTLEVATLVLDHTPKKGDTECGSGRKRDAVDVSWEVKGNFSTDRVGPLKLSLKKSRDGGLGEVVTFTFGGTPLRAQRGDMRKLAPHERTLEVLEDGMSAGEWLDASGASETTFFRHRDKLVAAGLVEKVDERYSHVGVEETQKWE